MVQADRTADEDEALDLRYDGDVYPTLLVFKTAWLCKGPGSQPAWPVQFSKNLFGVSFQISTPFRRHFVKPAVEQHPLGVWHTATTVSLG